MRSFGYFCYDVKQFVIYYWGKKKERRSQIESNLMFVEKWAHDFGDHHCFHLGLPWWLRWLRICLKCGRPGFDPWMGKIPWRREWLATPVILAWSVPWTEELGRDRIHGVTKSRTQLENWHTHTHCSHLTTSSMTLGTPETSWCPVCTLRHCLPHLSPGGTPRGHQVPWMAPYPHVEEWSPLCLALNSPPALWVLI